MTEIRDYDPPIWRIIVTALDSTTLACLDGRATGRQFLWTLNAPAYHTGQIPSDDIELTLPWPNLDSPSLVSNNTRLLFGFRRETALSPLDQPWIARFGGIIMTPEDQGADTPTTRYTAYDPWQYLMSRRVLNPSDGQPIGPNGLTFNEGAVLSDIALNLLVVSEAVDGPTHIDFSDLSLVTGTNILGQGTTGATLTLEQGIMLGEAWTRLTQTGLIDITLPALYEPLTSPGNVCSFATADQAGVPRYNIPMGWDIGPHTLAEINRMVDGTRLANEVQFFAGQGGPPTTVVYDTTSVNTYGTYWAQQFFPDSNNNPDLVYRLGVAELLIRRNGQKSISLDPTPELSALSLRDYGLGDYLPFWASRNLREPIAFDYTEPDPSTAGMQRVYAIPAELDDGGVERIRGLMTSPDAATS